MSSRLTTSKVLLVGGPHCLLRTRGAQDGGQSSQFLFPLPFGEGPADTGLSFTLLVKRDGDTEGQKGQPLPLPSLCIFSWQSSSPSLVGLVPAPNSPLSEQAPPAPSLSSNNLITSKCAWSPRDRRLEEGPALEQGGRRPGPRAAALQPSPPTALPPSLPVSTARPQRFPPFSVTRCLVIHGF